MRLATWLTASAFALLAAMAHARESDDAGENVPVTSGLESAWSTQKDARIFEVLIPAPRGQITDRHGRPLAQNRVGWYTALQLPTEGSWSSESVVGFARERIRKTDKVLSRQSELTNEKIEVHYVNRRWIPLRFGKVLTDRQVERLRESKILDDSLVLFPIYIRHYPEERLACHIIGYVGKKDRYSSKTPLMSGDPLFPRSKGRDGLEVVFDDCLRGEPGQKSWLFAPDGTRLMEETLKRPVQGGSLVTTLDLDLQRLAERTLSNYCSRGAFVVMDIRNGDVLAMASRPGFDLNRFVPAISAETFKELQEDERLPLFARAFRGQYPPASTFKVSVALAALEHGIVKPGTSIKCPGRFKVDNRYFHNWNRRHEGSMNVSKAIARSCNTWFYAVGLKLGGEGLVTMARRFGMGEPTGIQLRAEARGAVPFDEELKSRYGYGLAGGYLANASIGQGHVLATPLQVAQMMAGIANRSALPQARLIRQIQNNEGEVVKTFPVRTRTLMDIDNKWFEVVTQGMVDVVHAGYGTGHQGANNYRAVAAKTGTGQWGPLNKKQYVAWFAGFVPADKPQFAFAALYEGYPGQHLSGGKKAAPMVSYFFNRVFGKTLANGLLAKELEERTRIGGDPVAESEVVELGGAALPESSDF